jgi:hypothetical protein
MTRRWYRIHETGTGTIDDSYRADLDAYADRIEYREEYDPHPDGSPKRLVLVEGDWSLHDDLADDSKIQALDDVPYQALNAMFDVDLTKDER